MLRSTAPLDTSPPASVQSPLDALRSGGAHSQRVVAYALYAIAWGAMAGSDILSVPILSRIFSKDQYGQYLLIYGVIVFLSDAVSIWASTAFVRQAVSVSDPEARGRLKATLLGGVLIGSVAASAGFGLGAVIAARIGDSDLAKTLAAGTVYLPVLATITFILADLQVDGRAKPYCGVALMRTGGMLGGGFAAVALFSQSAATFLLGSACGLLVLVLPYWMKGFRYRPFGRGSAHTVREALSFGIGMWFQNLGAKILRIGDRYVIGGFLGAASVAVYGAGYTLVFGAIAVLISPLVTVLTPLVFSVADRDGDEAAAGILERILWLYVPVALLAVSLAYAFTPLALRVLLPPSYATTFSVEMILALLIAAAFHGGTLIINLSLSVRRRTMVSAVLFVLLAGLNLAANIAFVPAFGIRGAVWATLLSYVGLFAATAVVTQRYLPISLPIKLGVLGLGGLGVIYGTSRILGEVPELLLLAIQVGMAVVWFAFLLAMTSYVRGRLQLGHRKLGRQDSARMSHDRRDNVALRTNPIRRLSMEKSATTGALTMGATAGAAMIGLAIARSGSDGPILIVSIIAVLGCFGMSFVSPTLAIVLLVFAGRFTFGPAASGFLDIAFWTLLGLTFAILLRPRTEHIQPGLTHPIAAAFLCFAVLVLISHVQTWSSHYGSEKTFRVLVYGIAFLIIPLVFFRGAKDVAKFFYLFVLFVDFMGGISLAITLKSQHLAGIQRISPPGGGPITLARLLGLGVIGSIALALVQERHRRFWIANSLGLALLCFMTGSRAPFIFIVLIVLFTAMLMIFNVHTRRHAPKIVIAFVLLSILAIPAWGYAVSHDLPFAERFKLLTQQDKGASVDAREENYRIALDLSHQERWIGLGAGSWALIVEGTDVRAYPHNIFLEVLVEEGLLGVISLTVYLLAVLITGVRLLFIRHASRLEVVMTLAVLGSFVYSLMNAQTSGDVYDNRYIWFYGAVILASSQFMRVVTTRTEANEDRLSSPVLQYTGHARKHALVRDGAATGAGGA